MSRYAEIKGGLTQAVDQTTRLIERYRSKAITNLPREQQEQVVEVQSALDSLKKELDDEQGDSSIGTAFLDAVLKLNDLVLSEEMAFDKATAAKQTIVREEARLRAQETSGGKAKETVQGNETVQDDALEAIKSAGLHLEEYQARPSLGDEGNHAIVAECRSKLIGSYHAMLNGAVNDTALLGRLNHPAFEGGFLRFAREIGAARTQASDGSHEFGTSRTPESDFEPYCYTHGTNNPVPLCEILYPTSPGTGIAT